MELLEDEFLKIKTALSENIKRHREEHNLSQENLAELSGLHRTYIGSVERKERNVTLSTLIVIAAALKVSVPDLLRKKESE
ncbi:MAG: XRE family transcriptional regulator [Erysipelotrichia bacterium]|nr:XRE family transcriptional regulator [Erysipelotrichia bacterium]HCA6557620.1 helix-turn-helix transcriptional regulator [Escherichia coli]HEN7139661.1 helix-turn-helix transcriptional regulator [Escherichia coli]